MKRRTWLSLAIMVGTAAGALWLLDRNPRDWAHAPPSLQGLISPLPRTVGNFDLLTQDSQHFRREHLLGRWSFLYFGYLQCPDICPTTLQSMRAMQKLLSPAPVEVGAAEQFVFVSVDPVNDTPERIGPYLAYFGDAIVGLSGEPQQLASLADSVGVMYAEHIAEDGTRSMDHSTSIVLVDPQGRAVAVLPAPHQPVEMARQYRELRAWLE